MNPQRPTGDGDPGSLSDADLERLLDGFRTTDWTSIDLRLGETRLRLTRPDTPPPISVEGPKHTVTAPYVGTFCSSTAPGAQVRVGMSLGLIRSISDEIELRADVAGTVVAQLATDGSFVGYGDRLFEISATEGGQEA